jgi:hypothetical protein
MHVFDCAAFNVMGFLADCRCANADGLEAPTAQMSTERMLLSNSKGPAESERLLQALESHIAIEDPYNGEALLRTISRDFIDPSDVDVESWRI